MLKSLWLSSATIQEKGKVMLIDLEGVVDAHIHFRQGELLQGVVPFTAAYCSHALAMPNTNPGIFTGEEAGFYAEEIEQASGEEDFSVIRCIKLDNHITTPETIRRAKELGISVAKAYPIGATTGADETGVSDFDELAPVFAAMEEVDMVLSLHGEDPSHFVLDRESAFIPTLEWLVRRFPRLRIAAEHITTEELVNVVLSLPENVTGSITAHHLLETLDGLIGGLLRPSKFCKPVFKLPRDREALLNAAVSRKKIFFGSDSAPHVVESKYCDHGCAGAFTAPHALQLLAKAFEEALGRKSATIQSALQHFASDAAHAFYRLRPSKKVVRLMRGCGTMQIIPSHYAVGNTSIVPYRAGEELQWTLV